jgi:large subunit ribosomal protein L13
MWFIVDAEGKTLGRLSAAVAHVLRGKHKAQFAAHVDMGDCVIVINAEKIRVSGNKMEDKQYYSHSGYNSGLKAISMARLLQKKPTAVVQKSISGMIPANKLKKTVLSKLHVYAGVDHEHAAQKPEVLKV